MLGVWVIPAVVAIIVWLPLLRLQGSGTTVAASMPLWRNRFGLIRDRLHGLSIDAVLFAGFVVAVALLHERGLPIAAASYNLPLLFVTQTVFALIVPIVLVRVPRQEIVGVGLPAIVATGIVGAFYGPFEWIPVWSGIIGLALGGVFGVALTFLVLRARLVESAARLSGMAQTVGYVVASFGPLGIGLLHAAPDPLLATTIWLLILTAATMIFGVFAGKNAHAEGLDRRYVTPPNARARRCTPSAMRSSSSSAKPKTNSRLRRRFQDTARLENCS